MLTTPLNAEYEPQVYQYTPEALKEYAYTAAVIHRLKDAELFVKTLECESMYFKHKGQSLVRANGPFGREPSYGVAQFYIPSGLKTKDGDYITKEVALHPLKAIDAAAYNFSIGNAKHWTCYRKLL